MKIIKKPVQTLGAQALIFCFSSVLMGMSAVVMAAKADNEGHELKTKVRTVYFDRSFENDSNDREQSAFAVEANFTSAQFADIAGFGISGYIVEGLTESGLEREDVLTARDGEVDGFGLIGQAYLYLTPMDGLAVKIGRQKHKSLFLSSSGSRAVPNTFQGISATLKPSKGFSIYGAVYNKWSRRARDNFEGFATDQSAEGDISYVGLIGAKFKAGGFTTTGEYLTSEDYLSKLGLKTTYKHKFDASSLKVTGGIFTSMDDGDLFVTRAESGDLDDEDVDGSSAGVTSSENDGLGGYIEAAWKKGNGEISVAYAKIDEIWLEDNFTGDHGTNPFPTRSRVGPDLTNTNESVARLKASYNWKDMVPGLSTSASIAQGWDAENSVDKSLGTADEDWWEVYLRYKAPFLKGLQFTGIYHSYNSDETGSVDGVKADEDDIRIYLDYTHTF